VLAEGLETSLYGREERASAGEAPDPSGAIVAVDVGAREAGDLRPPVDVAAGDRAVAARVVVFEDRRGEGRRVTGRRRCAVGRFVGAVRALHALPAVVLPARTVRGGVVDLLPAVLAHVPDPEVVRHAVEGKAPGIAQPF